MSCPHFLFGAESLWQDVGLKPDYKLHGTQIYVEPTSGLLMKANKRIQYNTMIERDTRIKYENILELYIVTLLEN